MSTGRAGRFLCLSLLPAAALAQQEIWDKPAFSADPRQLLASVQELERPKQGGAAGLFHEISLRFDGDGRRVRTERTIYKVFSGQLPPQLQQISAAWRAWFQERPVLRARVTTSQGRTFTLDPSTITEAPAAQNASPAYDDARALVAPLPGIEPGAIVETEVLSRDQRPPFEAGLAESLILSAFIPYQRTRIILDVPSDVPLRYRGRRLPNLEVEDNQNRGRHEVVLQQGALDPISLKDLMGVLIGSPPTVATLEISTGASWNAIARAYARIVDKQRSRAKVPGDWPPQRDDRQATIAALLAKLHERVRYTAVELGAASITPRTPAETLQRAYGDCKDKSLLLVELLEDAGIDARLAILRAAPNEDVEPDMPGFGHFNHVIVYVPREQPVWIDPTVEFARAGELPSADQRRWALLIDPATTELVRTPASTSRDNGITIERVHTLSADGTVRLEETTSFSGTIEQQARGMLAGQSPRDVLAARRESLVKGGSDSIEDLDFNDPRDLSQSFRIHTTLRYEPRQDPAPETLSVSLSSLELLTRMPLSVGFGDDAKDKPLALPEPHHVTATWRLIPPPGFRPRLNQTNKSVALGPARLEKEFQQNDDGSLTVAMHFDSVQKEFSAGEAVALRKAYSEEMKAPKEIVFEDSVEALLRESRFGAAIGEARRRANAYPDDPFSRYRLVRAYLRAGAGAAARAEAQRLADDFPQQPAALMALGEALSCDLLGREFAPGFDRDHAAAAYRRALELKPKNRRLTRALVEVLKRSPEAVELGPGAEVDDAIQLARELHDEYHDPTDFYLLQDLLSRAERYQELADLAEQEGRGRDGSYFAVEAAAALQGLDGAQAMAARFPQQDARGRALVSAGWRLADARRYATSAELMEAGRDPSADASSTVQSAAIFRKTRRHEEVEFPAGDPRRVVIEWMRALLIGPDWKGAVEPLISAGCGRVELSDPRESRRFDTAVQQMRYSPEPKLHYLDRVLDNVLALTTFKVEGDASSVYRVHSTFANPANTQTIETDYFIVREGTELRLLDSTDGYSFTLAGVACRAGKLLNAEDLAGARRLLDWAAEIENSLLSNFRSIWCANCDRSSSDARLAIAILRSNVESLAAAEVPALREAYGREKAADRRLALNRALAAALKLTGRNEEALVLDREAFQEFPDYSPAFTGAAHTLSRLGRWDEAEQLLQERLKKQPRDERLLRFLQYVEMNRADWTAAAQVVESLERLGKATPGDRNNLAWTALVADTVNETARSVIDRAVADTQHRAYGILNTQAAIYAASGNADQARKIFLDSMKYSSALEPRAADWYVAGLIFEQYGLLEEAREAYGRAVSGDDSNEPAQTAALARRRLEKLKQ